jgi:hypothetical protein
MARRDPQQPRGQGRGIPQVSDLAPGSDHRVDDDLLRIGVRSDDEERDALEPGPEVGQQLIERLGAPIAQVADQTFAQA